MTYHAFYSALSRHMALRRDSVMNAWCASVAADPRLTSGSSLPRTQMRDHIPALLEHFEQQLQRLAAGADALSPTEEEPHYDGAAHGLHRWQQGFGLAEVTRELSWLNRCVVTELDIYACSDAPQELLAMAEVRKFWAALHGVAVNASTSQFFKLQQIEAASHAQELQAALHTLQELEQRRAELWQQAAHDLRGNLGVVANATAGLSAAPSSTDTREAFMRLLERNVVALHRLLEDVTSLARLQGGQEERRIEPMEASHVMRDICESLQPLAHERRLYLRFSGPSDLQIEGDEIKIRRIVQNLVLNAVKYTGSGGVIVRWATEEGSPPSRWFVEISDTGPGFKEGPGSAVALALEAATQLEKAVPLDGEAAETAHAAVAAQAAASQAAVSAVLVENPAAAPGPALRAASTPSQSAPAPVPAAGRDVRAVHQLPGEGIGLSIVKRLCELLDATLQLESEPGRGSTFRIVFPFGYPPG